MEESTASSGGGCGEGCRNCSGGGCGGGCVIVTSAEFSEEQQLEGGRQE